MTIDEAIAHAREVARRNRNFDVIPERVMTFGTYKEHCLECAKEHEQLAEWLEELKALKSPESTCRYWNSEHEDCTLNYDDIRNKAIDECLAVLYKNAGKIISIRFYEQIFDEMKQLKSGGEVASVNETASYNENTFLGELSRTNINETIIRKSIQYYGSETQKIVCMEECSELIQAISKEVRGKSDIEHLTEEMADVLICIELLKQMFGINESELQAWIDLKQERTVERMKGEQE